ncbi:tRNA dimethylallyltransferase [Geotalea uraniireducens]|uniref:tRNA dimethylallyltransferase n=1 Tax=Geotalea uraniireducens TaxID=351604 RepID=A0ABM8EKP9_9BACT|nr:tRNA (adenosine(37)-N6)-dimethylallyltransferase MiaA [Geotalea uraniireducens]BDV43013.1 tRNA dimethylallyltransferase [Geotalea uraniireducens]
MNPAAAERVKLVVIQGPTASGKSELAVRLAEQWNGEIINADSMQVYRGMDIGTAKPSAELRRRVPHHLLDIVDPDYNFSAADFQARATAAIADIHRRGRRAFVVGGTGLYLKALTRGLVDSPRGEGALRQELEERFDREGGELLLRELALADPATAERLHPNDRVRIVRALEVFLLTGRPFSTFHEEHRFAEEPYECLNLGLMVDREVLYRRVEERVEAMLAAGLVNEVRRLLAAGYSPELKALRSIGYKEVCAALAGEYPWEEAVRLIKRDTRRYAKRQLTWFKRETAIIWVEYPKNFASISNIVMGFYH